MFTAQQKQWFFELLRNCLQLNGVLHLVTHLDPDQDGAAAAFLIMNKMRLSPNSRNVSFHFVPQGQIMDTETFARRYQTGPHDLVINLDTGGYLDVENLVFDHHYVGCPFPSATAIIYELLYIREGYNPPGKYLRDMVAFVDRIDSGNKVNGLDPAVYEDIATLNEMLVDSHGKDAGRFVPNLPGPTWFMTLVKHKPTGVSDEWHMAMLIYALFTVAQQARDYYRMETSFLQELEAQLEIKDVGGLSVAFSAKNPFEPSKFRDAMNRRHNKDVDIVVYENTGMPEERGQFAIAILSRKEDMVVGMIELAATLRTLAPKAKIFLHQENFLIYIRALGSIPLPFDFNGLKVLVEAHLSKKAVSTGETTTTKEAPIA